MKIKLNKKVILVRMRVFTNPGYIRNWKFLKEEPWYRIKGFKNIRRWKPCITGYLTINRKLMEDEN